MFAESILDFKYTPSPSSGSKKKKKRKTKSSGFIDEIDNVRVNLESSFVLQMSDDSVQIQAANMIRLLHHPLLITQHHHHQGGEDAVAVVVVEAKSVDPI